jgi:hypothetical protein
LQAIVENYAVLEMNGVSLITQAFTIKTISYFKSLEFQAKAKLQL